jgi:5-methylthioadenosine/S-adenosylhomocysteine deaminase
MDNLTLIKGGHVVSGDPAVGHGADLQVLGRGDRILAVAPNIPVFSRNVKVIDAAGMIGAPGWVNNHQHMWESLVRGISADSTSAEHRDQVLAGLPPRLTVEDMYIGTLLGALDVLSNGTTTVVNWDLSGLSLAHALAAVNALADAGIRSLYSYSASVLTQDNPDGPPTEEDFMAVAEYTRSLPLVSMHMGTPNPVNRGDEVLQRVIRNFNLARELGITISLHAGLPTSQAVPGLLNDNGLLGPDVMFVNGSAFASTELALVAEHGAWITSVPEVEQQSAAPTPLRAMLSAGIRPTVSTDSFAYIPSDLPTQLRILLQSAREKERPDVPMLTMEDVFPYGNINPAASIGMEDSIGSLTPGKQADIILMNTREDLNTSLTTNVFADLIQMAHPGSIDTVMVAGRIVKRKGKLLGFHLTGLREEALAVQRRILETENC